MEFNFVTLLVVVHLIVSLLMLFDPAALDMLGAKSVVGFPGTNFALISSVVCLILLIIVMM